MVPSLLAAETVQFGPYCEGSTGVMGPWLSPAPRSAASPGRQRLQLDGNLHFNQVDPGTTRSPLHWALAGATLLLPHSALLPFLLSWRGQIREQSREDAAGLAAPGPPQL